MKNKFLSIIAASAAALSICGMSVYADDSFAAQYYTDDEGMTIYASGLEGDNITCRISGMKCDAVNEGEIYTEADRYDTLFLIDSSKSMINFSDEIADFYLECVDKKRDNEYYSVGIFSSGNAPTYLCDYDNNQYALQKIADELKYDYAATYIYDNLCNAIDTMSQEDTDSFKRIVLFTDGNENSAKGITIEDCIEKLEEYPVQIYTVTLLDSKKSNLEMLKNIARLARSSNGEDIRISSGSKAYENASVITDGTKNISRIRITPPEELLDGSIKAIELSDKSSNIIFDIRMPMTLKPAVTEKVTRPVTEQTTAATTAATEKTEPVIKKESKKDNKKLIGIIAVCIAVAAIIVVVIVIVNGKKKKKTADEPLSLADNDSTMIIGTRSGETEILLDGGNANSSVILRDIEDSMKTFEVQLSEKGMIIGRSSDFCNVIIDYDKSISRKHCRIFLKNGAAYIEDLGAGNKTCVNDIQLFEPQKLCNADEIKIGRTKFKVTIK